MVNDSGLGALSRLSLPFTFLHLCSCCGRGLGSIPRRLWCVGHLDGHPPGLFLVEGSDSVKLVVGIEAFIKKFPCITSSINKKYFSFSGEAKDSAIFAFYFLLHKRANPLLPPYPLPPPIHPPIPHTPTTLNPFLRPPIRNQPLTLLSAR